MTIHLSLAEYEVLSESLEIALSELRMEIADTDRKDFRDRLKEKRAVLEAILDRLVAQSRSADLGEPDRL